MTRILISLFLATVVAGGAFAETATQEHQELWDGHRKRFDAERQQRQPQAPPAPSQDEKGEESKSGQEPQPAKTN